MGSYRIEARLGAGGMGEVYRAFDEQLQRVVAIKILQPETASDEAFRKRLLREARAAAALNHPSICVVHEVGDAHGQSYIAMEYVEGRPLSAAIDAGEISADGLLRLARQMADGVAHAHERGVIHGDLKPANAIVTRDGRVKLVDFGLARQLSPDMATHDTGFLRQARRDRRHAGLHGSRTTARRTG